MREPLLICALLATPASADEPARPMVVIDEAATVRDEPPPHGAIGMSTAFRISDGVPARTMEFRKRVLHPGQRHGMPASASALVMAVGCTLHSRPFQARF